MGNLVGVSWLDCATCDLQIWGMAEYWYTYLFSVMQGIYTVTVYTNYDRRAEGNLRSQVREKHTWHIVKLTQVPKAGENH